MATSDKRRYVADAIRFYAHDGDESVYAFMRGYCPRELADLIDPTCTMRDATWDDGTCTWGCICSACGAKLEYEHAQDLAYCPDCGARNEGAGAWNA